MSGKVKKIENIIIKLFRNGKFLVSFPKNVLSIPKIYNKCSYYPEFKRKSKFQMWKDNFRWLCKDKELNSFYISYGLDVEGFRNQNDYIGHMSFVLDRNEANQNSIISKGVSYNYIVLLRDKYIFANYLAATLGIDSVVGVLGLLIDNKVYLCTKKEWMNLENFFVLMKNPLVFKALDEECAEDIYVVEKLNSFTFVVNGKEMTVNLFLNFLSNRKLIIQNIVKQHDKLSAFKTKSVSTIRIITIKGKSGIINVFSAFLRLSIDLDSFVDNRAKGGLGVGIDLDTGKLLKFGYPHDSFGVKIQKHPISNISFLNFQIPFWKETKQLVVQAHRQFYGIQSIGWDVIITNNGPIILEGNDDWEIGGPQDTMGGLRNRWDKLRNA